MVKSSHVGPSEREITTMFTIWGTLSTTFVLSLATWLFTCTAGLLFIPNPIWGIMIIASAATCSICGTILDILNDRSYSDVSSFDCEKMCVTQQPQLECLPQYEIQESDHLLRQEQTKSAPEIGIPPRSTSLIHYYDAVSRADPAPSYKSKDEDP